MVAEIAVFQSFPESILSSLNFFLSLHLFCISLDPFDLEQIGGQLSKLAALTLEQAHMASQRLALEALHQPGEAIALGIHIGIIDLK